MGPLLFLLYINNIQEALSNTHTYLYADDTNNFCQHKNVTKIRNVLNTEFENVCDWFVDNKLSIHFGEDKTKFILIFLASILILNKVVSFYNIYNPVFIIQIFLYQKR